MAYQILVYVLLAVFAGMLIVPFVIGLVKGPDQGEPRAPGDESMRPLSRVAGLYGRFLALYAAVAAASFGGRNRGSVCASTPFTSTVAAHGYGSRPGATIQVAGTVQACAVHPGGAQWLLYLMIRLPGPVLLATVLLCIWQLVRQASRNGPFSTQTAAIMWRLGIVVLAGSVLAGAVSELGNDLLARMLMTGPPFAGTGIAVDALAGGFRELLPVPALAGAALLTFARIIRAGAALDEEVRATV